MGDHSAPDLISNLPQSIIECILARLPIRDAIRTSILSGKWRYKWTTLTQLVFDDNCFFDTEDKNDDEDEERLAKFITHALFLHQGPIHKFDLYTGYEMSSSNVYQWMLYLSRNDIKELILDLEAGDWFRVPSSLFTCNKLSRLELCRCELELPPNFNGFLCLKRLKLRELSVVSEVVESLISSCPLLESLELSYIDSLALNICAPNLKDLCLEGEFMEICLENTPKLITMSVEMYMNDEYSDNFEQSCSCNFIKFLGGVPCLEKLSGRVYFTKYLSVGNITGAQSVTYIHLKILELGQVCFEDMKEILVVLRLITNSPNLKEFHIAASSKALAAASPVADLDFWENECPSNCRFGKLKFVKITAISGLPHEMEFVKFLLARTPVLETMSVTAHACLNGRYMMLRELVRYKRASPQAEILYDGR